MTLRNTEYRITFSSKAGRFYYCFAKQPASSGRNGSRLWRPPASTLPYGSMICSGSSCPFGNVNSR